MSKSEHAPLPPSSASQWGSCSGWRIATENIPNHETPETLAGTASHWVFETVFSRDGAIQARDLIGEAAPNGFIIDDKAADGAQVFIDDLLERIGGKPDFIEQRFQSPIHELVWGTVDAGHYDKTQNTIILPDYKAGHRLVRARGNRQLIIYAVSMAHSIGVSLADNPTIEFRVVQPFNYQLKGPVDVWTTDLKSIMGEVEHLRDMAYKSYSDPTLNPGAHCRDCKAVGVCSAARQYSYNAIDIAEQPFVMDAMTGDDLALERELLSGAVPVLKSRLDAITDTLESKLKSGEKINSVRLESHGKGARYWTCDPAVAAAVCDLFGFDIRKTSALTPTQALKLVPADKKEAFIEALKHFTSSKPSKLTITRLEDTISGRAFLRRENNANV